ncbi:hypothetical protein CHLRE_01g050150v5 [Chlamydomonas reinhardtii]|uniref:NADH:flavin oxidoreductase/NADH oxidase N-terminal domain-containing protein n=1 Tax=Chlamydomonas reinhardtii TaxID=3055 RepID=A0A2K3E7Z6_CHLRE|nr:uncharacterized protein CHLRE_01g050150v5 [Chlamydomonas reinhardtii]PNW88904.1 hypothetical protein CHLRE_01g050150v5 [Chlamydomonas reinhardtii]
MGSATKASGSACHVPGAASTAFAQPVRKHQPMRQPLHAVGTPGPSGRPLLFEPITLRQLTIPNRIWLSPMCQYSAVDGAPNTWHLVHLGARAAGGCGLVMTEACAVVPEGRISPSDAGMWNDAQVEAWRPIADFIRSHGAVPSVQLAHAGRKASTFEPFVQGGRPLYPGKDAAAWQVVAPSAVPFADFQTPREMTEADIREVIDAFAAAAERSIKAGFQVVEIHMAHGYLLHQFLSPQANKRKDQYGGSLANRMRLPLAVAEAVRAVIPPELPLAVRISATDWAGPLDGPAWDVDQSVVLCGALRDLGCDLIDVSSGGQLPRALIPVGPGYQVPFSERIRREARVATGTVGLITTGKQAEKILQEGKADVVLIGREMLRDPNWPLRAAAELGYEGARYPPQYERGKFPIK